MLKFARSLFGVIIAFVSIGSNAQAQFPYSNTPHGSSSFGDPAKQIDRPAGFGSINMQPRLLYPIGTPDPSTQCPAGSTRDRCNSVTTSKDRSSSKSTPAAANGLKNTPVVRQNPNANRNSYRVRWSNSNSFKQ